MAFFNACYPCVLKQVIHTAKLLKLDEDQINFLLNATMERLIHKKPHELPMHIILNINTIINNTYFTNNQAFDPYKQIKHHSNKTALKYLDALEKKIVNSPDSMEMALRICAMGNIIDFGAKTDGAIDIDHEIKTMDQLHFGIYHYDELVAKLKTASTLLFIGDNAGEIVFDKVFVRFLKKSFPDVTIVFAVRDKPIINDATLEDAQFIGLDKDVKVISSGSVYPGTILGETSRQFRGHFDSADLLIAKGQGNFESLGNLTKENLFFIFRVKCEHIAGSVGAKNNDLVLFQACKNCAVSS